MTLINLVNPSRFLPLSARLLPWLTAATLLAFVVAGVQTYLAPDDYQQGATGKIMFIHGPAARRGVFAWARVGEAAVGTLGWSPHLAPGAALAAAAIRREF